MMKNFDFDYLLWFFIVVWFFNGFNFAFEVSTDKKDDKTVISVESKPSEKKKEDKDTIKTDW